MNKRIKLSVFFLAISIILSSQSLAADRILPLPKPSVDEEAKMIRNINKITLCLGKILINLR